MQKGHAYTEVKMLPKPKKKPHIMINPNSDQMSIIENLDTVLEIQRLSI